MCYKCKGAVINYQHCEYSDETDDVMADISFKSVSDINADLVLATQISPIKSTKLSKDQIKRHLAIKADKVKSKILKISEPSLSLSYSDTQRVKPF